MISRFVKKYQIVVFAVAILILASAVRLYRLDSVPPSPYWEEVALGYDAYSISQTGKDHHGNTFPIIAFPSYGDYKPSGYFYAIIPFIQLLGLSVLAIRLPSALAGIITVGLLYLIGKEIRDQATGLVAAFVLAVSPWAIQFSRGGWEVNLAMTLIVAGATLLLYARKRPWLLLGSVICFALSMYTYHAARLFAPMIGGIGGLWILSQWTRMSFLRRQESSQKSSWPALAVSLITLGILLFPLVSNITNKSVSSRFSDTSIFSNPQPVLDSNAAIAAHGNTRLSKLLYHRYRYYGAIVLQQWASHFSPSFLFVRGDGNYRHGGWTGLLYPVDSVFILVSIALILVQLFRKHQRVLKAERWNLIACFVWIGLAAVPPALVTPAPHALRDLFAVPAYAILIAVGIMTVVKLFPIQYRRYVIGLIAAGYLFFGTSYFSQYLAIYPVKAQSDWQYGYEALFSQLKTYAVPSEQIYVSRALGQPSMYYLFYSKYDPLALQRIEPNLPKGQLELLQVGDYHFVDGVPGGPGIFAMPTGTIVVGGKIISNVVGIDGESIWTLWRK